MDTDKEKITYVSRHYGTLFFPRCSQEEDLPVKCRFYITKRNDSLVEVRKQYFTRISALQRKYFVGENGDRIPSENVVKVDIFPGACPTEKNEEAEFREYKRKRPDEQVSCLMVRNAEDELRFVRVPRESDRVVTYDEYSKMLKPLSSDGTVGPVIRIVRWVPLTALGNKDIGRGDSYYVCANGMETVEEGKRVRYCRECDVKNEAFLQINMSTFGGLLTAMKGREKVAVVSYRFRQGLDIKYFACTPCVDRDGWMIMIPFPFRQQRNLLNFPKLPAADPTLVASFEKLIVAREMKDPLSKKQLQEVETSAAFCREGLRKECNVPATEENIRLLLLSNPEEATREALQEMLDSRYHRVLPDGTIDPESGDPVRRAEDDLFTAVKALGLGPR